MKNCRKVLALKNYESLPIKELVEEGIRKISDLIDKIISERGYKILWLERCQQAENAMNKKNKK